jgi:oligoribonuclease NrnB/cAMP/cGMP phosphodiesterase (DHH superfamily)
LKWFPDVKEWERRMRLREFFFDQNEKEDVLTDDQKQYNFIKKKKSNWTPPTGRSEWLDLYLKLVKNDIISLCHL